jgi:hypothetical protein
MFRSLWAGLSRSHSPEFASEDTDSPGDDEMLNEIIGEIESGWRGGSVAAAPERQDLVDLALRRMQRDLQSARCIEVIADVQREIAYRAWCALGDPLEEELSSSSTLPPSRSGL